MALKDQLKLGVILADKKTGQEQAYLQPSSFSFSKTLNGIGSFSATFDKAQLSKFHYQPWGELMQAFIVLDDQLGVQRVLFAGWTLGGEIGTTAFSLVGSEFWWYLDKRLLRSNFTFNDVALNITRDLFQDHIFSFSDQSPDNWVNRSYAGMGGGGPYYLTRKTWTGRSRPSVWQAIQENIASSIYSQYLYSYISHSSGVFKVEPAYAVAPSYGNSSFSEANTHDYKLVFDRSLYANRIYVRSAAGASSAFTSADNHGSDPIFDSVEQAPSGDKSVSNQNYADDLLDRRQAGDATLSFSINPLAISTSLFDLEPGFIYRQHFKDFQGRTQNDVILTGYQVSFGESGFAASVNMKEADNFNFYSFGNDPM